MRNMELVFVPTPGMGHLRSTVELAKLILRRDDCVSVLILIINLPFDSASVKAYVDSQLCGAESSRGLTFLTLPPLSNPPDLDTPNLFDILVERHKPLVKQTVEDRISSGSPKPAGFVLDMFCSAMIDVANELNIRSYILFTSGAGFMSFWLHLLSLAHENNVVNLSTVLNDPNVEVDVPGFRTRVPHKVVPGMFLDEGLISMLNHARGMIRSKGILVNTFMELDSYAIQSLTDQGKGKIPTVYPVGPVLELDNKSPGGSKKEEQDSIMSWLDEQPAASVVFLCFGSMGSFDEDQVTEIANGLDRSGHRFLWSLRRPALDFQPGKQSEQESTLMDALPKGFVERIEGRGKIIGWAPQVPILAHKAVGGFVSHCGWNSILESLWFGVPMATWPMYAEQQLNAYELVTELELAVEIRMDYRRDWLTKKRNFVVTAEEVENGVKKLMSADNETRERVKEMSVKSRKALEDGGSSHCWMGRFIEDIFRNDGLN